MNIEKLIRREAPNKDTHDRAYAKALRSVYNCHKDRSCDDIETILNMARQAYALNGAGHFTTATCVVLSEILGEKTRKG